MSRREQLWTLPFVALTLSMLGVGFTFYLLVPTMAGYAVTEFGASQSAAGFASSSFFFGALAARLFAGKALVRQGIRRVVLASLTGLMLSCLAYLLPATLASTLVIRIAHGVFFGFSATALASAAMGLAPASRRGEASGWFMMGLTVATGFAPFAALGLVNSGAGQGLVFVVTAVCGALALVSVVLVAGRLPGPPDRPTSGAAVGLAALIDAKAVPIGAVVGLCALTYATVLAYLNLFAADRGLSGTAHLYFLVYALVILVSRPVAGIVQDRFHDDIVAVPVVVCVGVGTLLTALASGPFLLLAGAAVLGLGYGTLLSAGQAIAVSKVGHGRMGLGVSSYFLLVDFGTGLGPVLLSGLIAVLGYSGTFMAAAAIPVVALTLYLTVARRVPTAPAEV